MPSRPDAMANEAPGIEVRLESTDSASKRGLSFARILAEFQSNIQTLRVFLEQFSSLARDHDRHARDSFEQGAGPLLRSSIATDAQVTVTVQPTSVTTDTGGGVDAFELLRDPEVIQQLLRLAGRLRKAAPRQESVLYRSVIVLLISFLEDLIASLVHSYYLRYPAALPDETRPLTLRDLRRFESIQDAESHLVSLEVEALLREGLRSQIEYFAKRPRVDTTPIVPHLARLLEVDQRRNIVVHNAGVVNRIYLERVDPPLVELFQAKLGSSLVSTSEYVAGAMETVAAAGEILAQQCWRKWAASEVDAANNALVETCFQALLDERYELVISLAGYAASINLPSDTIARTMAVNHAIALRDTGRAAEAEEVLAALDWTSASAKFQVAMHGVLGDEEALCAALRRAVSASEISLDNIREWPLFAPFRQSSRFQLEVAELFELNEARRDARDTH